MIRKSTIAERAISGAIKMLHDGSPAERLNAARALFSLMPTKPMKESKATKRPYRKSRTYARTFVLKDMRHLPILKKYISKGDTIVIIAKTK